MVWRTVDTYDHDLDDDAIGAPIYDTGSEQEIGTIDDFDEDRVYVRPNEDVDEGAIDAFGWRGSGDTFELSTDAIEGLPEEHDADYGVNSEEYDPTDYTIDETYDPDSDERSRDDD